MHCKHTFYSFRLLQQHIFTGDWFIQNQSPPFLAAPQQSTTVHNMSLTVRSRSAYTIKAGFLKTFGKILLQSVIYDSHSFKPHQVLKLMMGRWDSIVTCPVSQVLKNTLIVLPLYWFIVLVIDIPFSWDFFGPLWYLSYTHSNWPEYKLFLSVITQASVCPLT